MQWRTMRQNQCKKRVKLRILKTNFTLQTVGCTVPSLTMQGEHVTDSRYFGTVLRALTIIITMEAISCCNQPTELN